MQICTYILSYPVSKLKARFKEDENLRAEFIIKHERHEV